MTELHLCQLAIMNEIQEWDNYSQMQLENTMKQSESFEAQLKEAKQRKSDAECKQVTLARVLDEACWSLLDFDIQAEEEPEQRIAKMKDYAQQTRSEIEKLKVEHEAQIAELQLHIAPESPPEVKEQHCRDIQASVTKISDLASSATKLLEKSVEAWENLQDHPEVEDLQETIKQR